MNPDWGYLGHSSTQLQPHTQPPRPKEGIQALSFLFLFLPGNLSHTVKNASLIKVTREGNFPPAALCLTVLILPLTRDSEGHFGDLGSADSPVHSSPYSHFCSAPVFCPDQELCFSSQEPLSLKFYSHIQQTTLQGSVVMLKKMSVISQAERTPPLGIKTCAPPP